MARQKITVGAIVVGIAGNMPVTVVALEVVRKRCLGGNVQDLRTTCQPAFI